MLEAFDGDIALAPALKGVRLERVDAEHPEAPAYLCLVKNRPIREDEAAPNPDLIPSAGMFAGHWYLESC